MAGSSTSSLWLGGSSDSSSENFARTSTQPADGCPWRRPGLIRTVLPQRTAASSSRTWLELLRTSQRVQHLALLKLDCHILDMVSVSGDAMRVRATEGGRPSQPTHHDVDGEVSAYSEFGFSDLAMEEEAVAKRFAPNVGDDADSQNSQKRLGKASTNTRNAVYDCGAITNGRQVRNDRGRKASALQICSEASCIRPIGRTSI